MKRIGLRPSEKIYEELSAEGKNTKPTIQLILNLQY